MATVKKTTEQRLKDIEDRLEKINKKRQEIKERFSKEQRARDTRRKIIVGSLILSESLKDKEVKKLLQSIISKNVTNQETIDLIQEVLIQNDETKKLSNEPPEFSE